MAIKWLLTILDKETGGQKAQYDATGSIASLTSFNREGSGNCLEATFTAIPNEVDIEENDVVSLQVSTDDGANYNPIYRGEVVTAGSPRSEEARTYKCRGIKQRYYEIRLEMARIEGDDVDNMALDVFTGITNPAGVGVSPSGGTQSFQLGDRFPALESAGEFLDALADSVGAFIAPSGGYTYDGVTYDEGDKVPATRWGVSGLGTFFFSRPQNTVELSEADPSVTVEWGDVTAEEVVNAVHVVFATELVLGDAKAFYLTGQPDSSGTYKTPESPAAHPIYESYGDTGVAYTKAHVVTLDAPIDYMSTASLTVANASGTFNNPSNAVDGDDTTFAEATTGVARRYRSPSGTVEGIWRLVFDVASDGDTIHLALQWETSTDVLLGAVEYDIEAEAGQEVVLYLPQPQPALLELAEAAEASVDRISAYFLSMPSGVKLYEIGLYVPDTSATELLAEAYKRSAQRNASSVTVVTKAGEDLPSLAATMRLTPVGEDVIEVPVERVETSVTNDGGLSTTYHLGQAFDAELMSQKAVLEGLARRVAKRENK